MYNNQALRIFKLDLREKVQSIWDENIPIIHHTVVELVTKSKFENSDVDKFVESLCKELELNVVKKTDFTFTPQGYSMVYILEESHIAVHTWPEVGYIHIDMVTCQKEETNLIKILNTLEKSLDDPNMRIINFKY